MIKRFKKSGHKCRQAFTLVEMLVVLAILSVVAVMFVPSLIGYIDKSRKSKYIQEADAFRIASQAVMSEWYAVDGGRIDYRDIFWDAKSADKEWGDKILQLMGYSRGDKREPYILVIGVGYPEDQSLSESSKYTVYYVGYVADKKSPAVFYVNGEWIYTYPTDNPVYVSKEGVGGDGSNIKNFIVKPEGTRIRIQYFVICNNTGQSNSNFWRNGSNSLRGHSEPHFKG